MAAPHLIEPDFWHREIEEIVSLTRRVGKVGSLDGARAHAAALG